MMMTLMVLMIINVAIVNDECYDIIDLLYDENAGMLVLLLLLMIQPYNL